MLLDSHAHLISDDPVRYPAAGTGATVSPDLLDRPMTAERLIQEMDDNGVARALAVQRGQIYGFDNSYVCDSVRAHPDRLRAVCAIDGRDTRCGQHVRYWVREQGAVGIRLMEPARGVDLSWCVGESARFAWLAAAECAVPVCVHVFPWNRHACLESLTRTLAEFTQVPVVIDHLSNIGAGAGPPDFGIDEVLLGLSRISNVHVKFTTIPLGILDEKRIDSAPLIARVVREFGASRVMWGSDIAQSKGSYAHMVGLARQATRMLSEAQSKQVLGESAGSIYWKK